RNVALILRTSKDNGATWSKANIIADHGPSRMPIESVIRTIDGKIILICDKGPTSLWISKDNGLSWYSPAGHVKGKHAPLAQLNDGSLLAFGREVPIDGKMPMSVSKDMGKTWEYSASEFQPVNLGQRSLLLRLKEGPIMFASFCKKMLITDKAGNQRPVSGLFTAVSDDEGKTWINRKLVSDDGPGRWVNTMNGHPIRMDAYNSESAAYLTVCQSANGVINLLSSRQHYAFNYKWLITPSDEADPVPPQPKVSVLPVKKELSNVFGTAELLKTGGEWTWASEGGSSSKKQNDNGQMEVNTEKKQEISCRSNGIDKINIDKGFTFEVRVQVIKTASDDRGIDVELYDGSASRYALTIKEKGIYWYEGLILGSTSLDFTQFTTIIADSIDNTDKFHTFRIAVTSDRVAQIYRDGKLVGIKASEYRTPRGQYLQFGAGKNVAGAIEYVGYDLDGAFQY
ncbi:MAG: exo-alpha-sialidase, partial [Candidatus Brocadiia bacterium]